MNDQRWKSCFQAPCNAPSYSHHQSNTEAWLNNRGIILFQMRIFSLDSIFGWVCGCWVTKSCPCMQPQGLKHSRLPCPSPSPGVCSNSCPLSRWCHPIISSSVTPFFSCLQSFLASGSFPIGWLLTSGGQSTGASASHQPFQWIFSVDFLEDWCLSSLLSKGLSRVFSNTTIQKHQFFGAQPSLWSNSHIHTWLGKTTALTRWTFVSKVMSLLFNMLSRFVITLLPKSKCLLIPWLQSLFTMILKCKKIKSVTVSTFSPSICHEVIGLDAWS